MKKKVLIALSAVVAMGLSSCVEQVDVNPSFNPETRTVNTTFVLNIAAADTDPLTKMTAANVQANPTSGMNPFRGIENATLFAFKVDNSDDVNKMKVLHPGKALASIDLSTALTESAIGGDGVTRPKSRRVMEIPIPLETNAMIFYGMAAKNKKSSEEVGAMEYIFPGDDISTIGSYASRRLSNKIVPPATVSAQTNYDRIESIILAILNHMLRIGIGNTDAVNNPWENVAVKNSTYKNRIVYWVDYLKAVDPELNSDKKVHSPINSSKDPYPLEILLGTTYQAFTSIKSTEARAGSGASIAREIYDMSFIVADGVNAVPISEEEKVAQEIFVQIQNFLTTFFDKSGKWMDLSHVWSRMGPDPKDGESDAIYYNFRAGLTIPEQGTSVTYTLQGFPNHFHLPMGAAILGSEEKAYGEGDAARTFRQFVYADNPNSPSTIAVKGQSIEDITYPPELCYYCNSPLRISEDNDVVAKDFPDGTEDWSSNEKWSSKWKKGYGSVTTATRGVAMAYNVQYGMALLETKVHFRIDDEMYKDNTKTTVVLLDNYAKLHEGTGAKDKEIEITDNEPLVLKGIMIGGQPSVVNWNYLPWVDYKGFNGEMPNGPFSWNKMVYDSDMADKTYTNAAEEIKGTRIPMQGDINPNYTVLFDNYDPTASEQAKVFVSLEFVNKTGTDFWGQDNMIRADGTFYLVAELNPAKATSTPKWPDNYDEMMPPYDNAGKTIRTPRVFMQDFVTKATFIIGKDALKKALVSVPDLRAAKLSVGLSVDLEWKEGLDIEVPLN